MDREVARDRLHLLPLVPGQITLALTVRRIAARQTCASAGPSVTALRWQRCSCSICQALRYAQHTNLAAAVAFRGCRRVPVLFGCFGLVVGKGQVDQRPFKTANSYERLRHGHAWAEEGDSSARALLLDASSGRRQCAIIEPGRDLCFSTHLTCALPPEGAAMPLAAR